MFTNKIILKIYATDDLLSLTSRFWEWRLRNSPEYGTKYGIQLYDNELEQFTVEAMDQQVKKALIFLQEAKKIPINNLNEKDAISLEVLEDLLNSYIRGYHYRSYGAYVGLGVFDNPLIEMKTLISWMKFNTEGEYRDVLSRYRKFSTSLVQKQKLLEIAIANETYRSLGSFEIVADMFQQFLSKPNDTFFLEPFKRMKDITNAAHLQKEVAVIIKETILPAVAKYNDFINEKYRPKARKLGGVFALPGGREYYRECLRWHLSLDYTPQQIYDLGIKEVERISQQIKQLINEANFDGDVRSYLDYLRKQPENVFTSEEEMIEAFKDAIHEIEEKLPNIIDMPTQIKLSIVKAGSENSPTGKYTEPALDGSRGGIFAANVHDPTNRLRLGVLPLTLHEVQPGHHTQMSFIINEQLANFRRAIEYRKYYAVPFNWPFYTAYVEGWALYSESLADEMGLAPEQAQTRLGRYTSEMLRACRLVVDAGIHEFGWTATKAQDYLRNYTDLPDTQIRTEVLRYSSYPGQATAYKIGELTIKGLRKEAEKALGPDFDLKKFHGTILRLGPVPLTILERVVRNWVDREGGVSRAIKSGAESPRAMLGPATLALWCCLHHVMK